MGRSLQPYVLTEARFSFPSGASLTLSPYPHTYMHTNAQANSQGADLFKQCHHSHLGHRRKYGVGSKQSQKSVNGHQGLGEEGWLWAQALGAPRAIPGPLPTADPAPPSRSHPQHNHTTTHHPATPHNRPAPPATLPQTAPPTMYGAQRRKSSTFASQLCRSFSSPITPLGGRTRSKSLPLLEFTAHPIPHRPAVLPG